MDHAEGGAWSCLGGCGDSRRSVASVGDACFDGPSCKRVRSTSACCTARTRASCVDPLQDEACGMYAPHVTSLSFTAAGVDTTNPSPRCCERGDLTAHRGIWKKSVDNRRTCFLPGAAVIAAVHGHPVSVTCQGCAPLTEQNMRRDGMSKPQLSEMQRIPAADGPGQRRRASICRLPETGCEQDNAHCCHWARLPSLSLRPVDKWLRRRR